jgi:hypothetical protein
MIKRELRHEFIWFDKAPTSTGEYNKIYFIINDLGLQQ